MTKATIHTEGEIIAAGEALERQEGRVEPYKIFKALGGRGRFDRVREVWERHVAGRGRPNKATPASGLPENLGAGIAKHVVILMEELNKVFGAHDAAVTADHVAQIQLVQRQHAKQSARQLAEQEQEVAFWRDRAVALEAEVEQLRAAQAQLWPLSPARTLDGVQRVDGRVVLGVRLGGVPLPCAQAIASITGSCSADERRSGPRGSDAGCPAAALRGAGAATATPLPTPATCGLGGRHGDAAAPGWAGAWVPGSECRV